MEKLSIILLTVGGILIIAAGFREGWSYKSLGQSQAGLKFNEEAKLEGNVFEEWKSPKIISYTKYYFYNVTNSGNIGLRTGKVKPIFDEVGPYVFELKRSKLIISTDETKDTIKYKESVTYIFRPDLSSGTEEDNLVMLNLPMVALSEQILSGRTSTALVYATVEEISNAGEKLFMTHTVKEMLFQGYVQKVFQELTKLSGEAYLPNNTFGLMYGKNGTLSQIYEVQRGLKDSSEFGRIVSWMEEPNLSWWKDHASTCNTIKGTDGTIFPAQLTRDTILHVFREDLCRSVYLTYEKNIEVAGISGYRFSLPKKIFERPTDNPENECFCMSDDLTKCKAGLINLRVCKKGAPIFASLPHFLYGEAEDATEAGLNPNTEKDTIYIDVEPNTGVLLQSSIKIQINIHLKPNRRIPMFKFAPDMIFPVIWADQQAKISTDQIEALKHKIK